MNRHEYSVVDLTMKVHAQLTGSGSHFFSHQDLGAAVVWLQWRTMDGQGWQPFSTTSSEFDECVQKLAHAVLKMYQHHLATRELHKVDNLIAQNGLSPAELEHATDEFKKVVYAGGPGEPRKAEPLEPAFDVTKELDTIRSNIIAGLAVPPELLEAGGPHPLHVFEAQEKARRRDK